MASEPRKRSPADDRKDVTPPVTDGPPDLEGTFRSLVPFEVLQMVGDLGRSGSLLVVDEEGEESSIGLRDGTIIRAASRHLVDDEAVLDILTRRQHRFRFFRRTGSEPGLRPDARSLQDLLLSSARLEDELELRAFHLPPEDAPLRHLSTSVSEDPLECSAREVFAVVHARTGVTRSQLEGELPMSCVKVRLSLAWLVQQQHLRQRSPSSVAQRMSLGSAPSWYQRLIFNTGNGARILMAVPEGFDVAGMLAALGSELRAEVNASQGLGEGPIFARVRPRAGGLISVTLVTPGRRSAALIPSLSRAVNLNILASEVAAELDEKAVVYRVPQAELKPTTLLDALRWLSERSRAA